MFEVATPRATLPQIRAHADELRGIVAALIPDEVVASQAPRIWAGFDAIERLAASAKILLARRVEDSGIWEREGDHSAAHYLARKSGTSIRTSRGELATSKRIVKLAATEAALRSGQLSASQAESIADAASHNRDAEQELLETASRSSLAELREECARKKAAGDPDPEATYNRIHESRFLRRRRDGEGGWNVTARGTPDAGALFNSALDPIIDEIFRTAWAEGRREDPENYAFDALLEMARRARDGYDPSVVDDSDDIDTIDTIDEADESDEHDDHHDEPVDDRGDHHEGDGDVAESRQRREAKRKRNAENPTYLALLRVDFAALRRGYVEGDELCEIQGVGPIPVPKARELLGQSVVKLIATKGKQVVNVTHYGRNPTVAQRMALLWSQPTCTVSGCNNTFAQFDHRIDWHITHHTKLDELDRLCARHHRLKTNQGWALVGGTGKRPLVPPDDPRHPKNQPKRTDRAA